MAIPAFFRTEIDWFFLYPGDSYASGAPRSESAIIMIAGGNHTIFEPLQQCGRAKTAAFAAVFATRKEERKNEKDDR